MALVVPGNHSDIIPPPPQNPPTIEDVGRARLYETNMNLLHLQRGTLANAPTDAECGEVARYALAVVVQNAPADAAPAWFNGALQVALQPILDEVQGLRNDVRGVQRELLISGNRSKGDGLRMPFAIVPNGDGNLPDATLNLPELSSVAVLNGLTHAQAMNWYRHYFPAGANNQSRAAMLNQIAHYIGYCRS